MRRLISSSLHQGRGGEARPPSVSFHANRIEGARFCALEARLLFLRCGSLTKSIAQIRKPVECKLEPFHQPNFSSMMLSPIQRVLRIRQRTSRTLQEAESSRSLIDGRIRPLCALWDNSKSNFPWTQ
jgi:hypothetical protein